MVLERKNFQSLDALRSFVRNTDSPMLFTASQSSTVIPFERIDSYFESEALPHMTLVSLSDLPKKCELHDVELVIQGAVTWKDARVYCRSKGRDMMTGPTEELAAIPAGVATSCTGERAFGFGTLRDQVISLEYMDANGDLHRVRSVDDLIESVELSDELRSSLKNYQLEYEKFQNFKNAPFPRLEKMTDLLTGTEGQIGVVTEVRLKTIPFYDVVYIFLALPKWEENLQGHMEVFHAVQNLRDKVFACEIMDENSIAYLPKEDRPVEGKDLIFLEVARDSFDDVYEVLLSKLEHVNENDIFEMSYQKCHEMRMAVPRNIFEENSKMGVVKKGTDVQVSPENFEKLLNYYASWKDCGVKYNLFGHFGDAHLHYNFMPNPSEVDDCQKRLESLYQKVYEWEGSPFAEHGIGLIKQKFIKKYYSDVHYETFSLLKKHFDPSGKFFPIGFMGMKKQ